jgi:RNA polymerase sigma factor (sigma-70 family)
MATAQLGTLLRHIKGLAAGHGGQHRTDRQLLDDFAARGDQSAFAGLVDRHGPMVLRVCRRVLRHEQDAEDAFQATFLVLARHPGSIRRREALASWLYGVAYRTAMKAKRGAARRRNHEARLRERTPPAAPSPTWDDVQAVLDEEIQRLPESFRSAFVLCALQGQTVPAAAAELGVKEGTLSWRLARARQRLRQQLSRRGIELSAVLAALSLVPGAGEAAVPAALAGATIRFGLSVAAGGPAAATIPSHIAALAAGVTRAMSLTKAQIAAALLLTVSLLAAAAGAVGYQAFGAGEKESPAAAARPAAPPAPKADTPARPAQAPEADASATFSGRVLDPEGKPFSGAKLHLIGTFLSRQNPVHVQGTSAADGAFRLPVVPADARRLGDDASWATTAVVATADGYGPAFRVAAAFQPAADLTLRLAKDDVPIHGRVLDLQGKPLPGVTVRVDGLSIPTAGTLTPWLEALGANREDGYPIEYRFLERADLPPAVFPDLVTDAGGRFQLKGVGRERLVHLTLQGPTTVISRVSVMTRPGKPIHAAMFARNPGGGRLTYYGANFDHPAALSRPIVGVVRDKDTGKPLAGVTVQSDKFAGVNVSGDSSVRTVTDTDGRYRLVGMPKGQGNVIKAVPAPGQPYLQCQRRVEDAPGLGPVTVDFELKRGVLVKGRVLDKATGEPVFANVLYLVFADNLRYKNVPGFTVEQYLQTGEGGSFQLVALPGRGLLTARGWSDHYRAGVGADRIKDKDWYQDRVNGHLLTEPFLCHAFTVHTLVEIDPPEKAESLSQDILLDPGRMPRATVVGPDGKPLAGAQALGLTAFHKSPNWTRAPLKSAECTVYGFGADDERRVVFVHPGRRLAGALNVRGDAKGPLTVKLEPWGTVTGRLVRPDGTPQPGVLLQVADRMLPNPSFQTDKDGRFRVEGLAPGVKYTLQVVQNGRPASEVFAGLALKAAEARDLGDVVVPPKK